MYCGCAPCPCTGGVLCSCASCPCPGAACACVSNCSKFDCAECTCPEFTPPKPIILSKIPLPLWFKGPGGLLSLYPTISGLKAIGALFTATE